MWFSSWLSNRKQADAGKGGRTHAPPRRRSTFRPRLEALEDRWVPSTLTVTNNLDSGAGSLRADISKAHSGDTIVFAPNLVGQTITLTSGELYINKNVTITGPGAGQVTVSAGGHSRVFEVAAKYGLTVSGLTISNGYVDPITTVFTYGAGIYNHGTLTVNGCTLSGNTATSGAAIFNDSGATMTVSGCTLSGNTALGGNSFGGAIDNCGTATISNSTLSGNSASGLDYGFGNGGAIYNAGTMTVSGCTLSSNRAGALGGAIYNDHGIMTVSGCILSSNSDSSVASTGGCAIYNNSSVSLTINNCSFSGNVASYTNSYNYIIGYWSGTGNTFS